MVGRVRRKLAASTTFIPIETTGLIALRNGRLRLRCNRQQWAITCPADTILQTAAFRTIAALRVDRAVSTTLLHRTRSDARKGQALRKIIAGRGPRLGARAAPLARSYAALRVKISCRCATEPRIVRAKRVSDLRPAIADAFAIKQALQFRLSRPALMAKARDHCEQESASKLGGS